MVNPHLIFSQKLLHIYKRCDRVFLNHCLHAAVLSAFIWQQIDRATFYLWFCVILLGGLWQWRAGRQYLTQIERYSEGKSSVSHIVAAGVAGSSFGFTALLFPGFTLWLRLLVLLLFAAIAAGALPRLAALPSAYAAYLAGVIGPAAVVQTGIEGDLTWQVIPALTLMSASLLYSARNVHADLMDSLISRFDLENAADEDRLTRIANRRRFDQRLEQEWRRASRNQVPLSLILIDVDFFKKFNDRYGHQEGDDCLQQVAQALARSAQRVSDLVARYGGEEFVILLYHMTRDDAYQLAERTRIAVANLGIPHQDSPQGHVTISLGGASVLPSEHGDPKSLVEAADKALYRAKEKGRNRREW
ncbi:MAG: diguanylate cyclase domain-containing protein [Gammaproteobacteria bacterium]